MSLEGVSRVTGGGDISATPSVVDGISDLRLCSEQGFLRSSPRRQRRSFQTTTYLDTMVVFVVDILATDSGPLSEEAVESKYPSVSPCRFLRLSDAIAVL